MRQLFKVIPALLIAVTFSAVAQDQYDAVEERILALQERKRELADAALGEADRATAITRDELLELLS